MKKKPKKGVVIGIDLGTTYSAAAIYESDGKTKTVPNADGDMLTPSVVNLREEKAPVVGRAADHQAALHPEYTAALFKRSMGRVDSAGEPIPAFVHPDSGKAYPPEELSSFVIRFLVESVKAATGLDVIGVVISVPAYFEHTAREATRNAGVLAGVNVLQIVNEPTSATLAFGLERDEVGTLAVYDLGGGTFDISIVRVDGGNLEVLATDGDRDLGGSDIDNLLQGKAIEAFTAEHGIEIKPDADLIVWRETREKSETAKKTLSQSESVSFMLADAGKRLIFELNRSEFNEMIQPIIEKTKAITQRALEASKLIAKDIDDVVLVGGSTRIPAVRDMLAELFGKAPRTDINPDEAVALGAAIYSSRIAADSGLSVVDSKGEKALPAAVKVTDVTSHPLGCIAKVRGEDRNCVIIPANETLPAKMDETFAVLDESQAVVRVTIASGPDGALPVECKIYGDLTLSGLPPRPVNEDTIRVTYEFTVEGTLNVTITDLISGKSTSELKRGFDGLLGSASEN